MPYLLCCQPSRVVPPPPNEAETKEPAEDNGGKIDYLRTPESFTMQRIAAGMHMRNQDKILKDTTKTAIELAVSRYAVHC